MNFTKTSDRGIMESYRSMPIKDLTSSNENTFAMDRKEYTKTSKITTIPAKKWYGNSGNRDASSIAKSRRVESAKGSINENNKPHAFTNTNERNMRNTALNRVRNSGYTVPPKVQMTNA
tara:strand:+ start:55 stop:411 length:357 start_codon:yes stop_codon:yes gene_type:complete